MNKQPRRLPPLELLRSFEAAARHLSFTQAARSLFVTQSAVSRAVMALEDRLGVKLFHRRHRALVLTEPGQRLYAAASAALEQLREACQQVRRSGESGVLTVTTTISFASMWLVPRLQDFRERHPETEVRIVASNEFSDLERQGIDVAIRFCTPKAAPPGAMKLFGEQVFPVCSPGLRRKKALRTPDDLRNQTLLHYDDPATCWPWLQWSVWFEVVKEKPPSLSSGLRFSHYDQVIQAAIAGQGVALGRSPLVRQLIRQGKLVAPFGERAASSRAYFALTAAGADKRLAVRHFLDWLVDAARREREE